MRFSSLPTKHKARASEQANTVLWSCHIWSTNTLNTLQVRTHMFIGKRIQHLQFLLQAADSAQVMSWAYIIHTIKKYLPFT